MGKGTLSHKGRGSSFPISHLCFINSAILLWFQYCACRFIVNYWYWTVVGIDCNFMDVSGTIYTRRCYADAGGVMFIKQTLMFNTQAIHIGTKTVENVTIGNQTISPESLYCVAECQHGVPINMRNSLCGCVPQLYRPLSYSIFILIGLLYPHYLSWYHSLLFLQK